MVRLVVPSSVDDVAMLSADHNAMERARYPRKGLLTIGPLGFQEALLLATDQYPESWKSGQMKCKEQYFWSPALFSIFFPSSKERKNTAESTIVKSSFEGSSPSPTRFFYVKDGYQTGQT